MASEWFPKPYFFRDFFIGAVPGQIQLFLLITFIGVTASIKEVGGAEENKGAKILADAINYAADNDARVINMSF